MKSKLKNAVEQYQCPGCVGGSNISCYKGDNTQCTKHVAGTVIYPAIGTIFLGMSTGFNRKGNDENLVIGMFNKLSEWGEYDKFNVPCWKYKDKSGNTLVRGLSPRLNKTFLHVFLEDCMTDINCLEITENDISKMDQKKIYVFLEYTSYTIIFKKDRNKIDKFLIAKEE